MNGVLLRGSFAFAIAVLCLGIAASSALAAEASYEFDPALSLTGDCSTSPVDPIPDPGCPNPPRPSARFDEPSGIGIDRYGNEYVVSHAFDGFEGRIDVFDDEGHFLTEVPDPNGPWGVAIDSKGTLYTFEHALGGTSQVRRFKPTVYEPEAGNIKYGNPPEVILANENIFNGGVAVDASNDHLFVAEGNFIAEFSSAETNNEPLATITSTNPSLSSSTWVAVDAQRRLLYASSCKDGIAECGVLIFEADAPYALLDEIDGSTTPAGKFRSGKGWLSIAVDELTGHVLIDDLEKTQNIYEFDENHDYVSTLQSSTFQGGNSLQIAISNAATAFNYRYLFVPVEARKAGRALAFKVAAAAAPIVDGAAAAGIGETEAELQAFLDPKGADTHYVFEYVTEQEFEEEGFANALIAGEGTVSGASLRRRVIGPVSGLMPATSYRFRVVATNSKGTDEEASSFTTYSDASPDSGGPCPNQDLRDGPSSSLPDCRAYELVTPADTNGRPPRGLGAGINNHFQTVLSSPSGGVVSFLTEGGPLPGFEGTGGFNGDPYRATRSPSGWSTAAVGPTGTEATVALPASTSPDQGYLFWAAEKEGTAVQEGRSTNYVRYPDGDSALIGRGSLGSDPSALGKLITENGSHIIFQTQNSGGEPAQQLEPDAPAVVDEGNNFLKGTPAVYDRTSDEVTHVVSLLPGNITPDAGEAATYRGASANGAGIAFSIGSTLYLRLNNAVTYEVGENVAFAGVSAGGTRVFYVEGGDLFAFDADAGEPVVFTSTGDAVVVNVAPSGTRAYFVSTTAIADSGENPIGDVAQTGQQNLYLSEEGDVRFIAGVTVRDVEGDVNEVNTNVDGLGLWTFSFNELAAAIDPSRSTPGGSVFLFQSRANIVGYDPGGFPQIYRFDSVANRLDCISCIPSRVPATGGAALQTIVGSQQATGEIPLNLFAFVPNLRADGQRAFFESEEALVARDTNEVRDVYEWEEQGVGSCERAGGCVYLISSGHGASDNYLYGMSGSGDDVFFSTDAVLVPGDDDTRSIYDARVGGGFPDAEASGCQGEGCRPTIAPAPPMLSAAPPAIGAKDNVARRCPRGKKAVKRRGKVRCVKKHRHHKHHKPNTKKGAGR